MPIIHVSEANRTRFRVATGQLLYRGLFFETTGADKTGVIYTLKTKEHHGYPSLYQLYMEADDPTEYTFATTNLDSWEHWTELCKCTWFKPYVKAWREELDVRTRAKSLNAIKDIAAKGGKESYQAHKFLLQGEYKPTKAHGRGRPSKQEVADEAQRQAFETRELNEEFHRVTGIQ